MILGIVKICSNTGLRISDVLNLTFEDFDKDSENLILTEKKTKKSKKIVFNSSCMEIIEELKIYYENKKIVGYEKGYLFKSLKYPESALTYQGVNYHIKRIRKELKISYPFNTHSFRKTWARTVYFKYNDLVLVMKALNHTNPSVTLRYIGIDDDDLKKIYTEVNF